jgi:hypothetical protein
MVTREEMLKCMDSPHCIDEDSEEDCSYFRYPDPCPVYEAIRALLTTPPDRDDDAMREKVKKLVETLKNIAKGEGPFDHDPLIHAINTIDDMKILARAALAEVDAEGEK